MNIKVVYNGPINEKLDKLISKMFEDNGFEWYAQGMDLMTKERDIAFDVPEVLTKEEG